MKTASRARSAKTILRNCVKFSQRSFHLPNRLIRDGHLDSERVDALSFGAEVFYSRLRLVVDDYGRFEYAPVVLLAKTFPRRADILKAPQIEEWMQELTAGDRPLVILYQAGRKQYLQVQDFGQRIRSRKVGNRTELVPSKFPPPPDAAPHECENEEWQQSFPGMEDGGDDNNPQDSGSRIFAANGGESPRVAAYARASSPSSSTPPATSPEVSFPQAASLVQREFPGSPPSHLADLIAEARSAEPGITDEKLTAALKATQWRKQMSARGWNTRLAPYLAIVQVVQSPTSLDRCQTCGDVGLCGCMKTRLSDAGLHHVATGEKPPQKPPGCAVREIGAKTRRGGET